MPMSCAMRASGTLSKGYVSCGSSLLFMARSMPRSGRRWLLSGLGQGGVGSVDVFRLAWLHVIPVG